MGRKKPAFSRRLGSVEEDQEQDFGGEPRHFVRIWPPILPSSTAFRITEPFGSVPIVWETAGNKKSEDVALRSLCLYYTCVCDLVK